MTAAASLGSAESAPLAVRLVWKLRSAVQAAAGAGATRDAFHKRVEAEDALVAEVERLVALAGRGGAPDLDEAFAMGAVGGPVVEAERLAFEAWMRGHCWAFSPTWDGRHYNDRPEYTEAGALDPLAMQTRRLWAAWRDRAALAAASSAGEKPAAL